MLQTYCSRVITCAHVCVLKSTNIFDICCIYPFIGQHSYPRLCIRVQPGTDPCRPGNESVVPISVCRCSWLLVPEKFIQTQSNDCNT
jgi:hypothetical protein